MNYRFLFLITFLSFPARGLSQSIPAIDQQEYKKSSQHTDLKNGKLEHEQYFNGFDADSLLLASIRNLS